MMEDFVDDEISYLNTMLMMQENISSHLKMKHGVEVVPGSFFPPLSLVFALLSNPLVRSYIFFAR